MRPETDVIIFHSIKISCLSCSNTFNDSTRASVVAHNSNVIGRIDILLEVFLDLRDVHGLSDSGVSVAHQ